MALRPLRAGDVVIRFGQSDHWRGVVRESIRGGYRRVEWQDRSETIEEAGRLLRVVGAPNPLETPNASSD